MCIQFAALNMQDSNFALICISVVNKSRIKSKRRRVSHVTRVTWIVNRFPIALVYVVAIKRLHSFHLREQQVIIGVLACTLWQPLIVVFRVIYSFASSSQEYNRMLRSRFKMAANANNSVAFFFQFTFIFRFSALCDKLTEFSLAMIKFQSRVKDVSRLYM